MRRLSANYVLPVSQPPVKNGILEIDNSGIIQGLTDPSVNPVELSNIECFEGIIVPGFVNAHCHLELSHLANQISPKQGMASFIKDVQEKRNKADNLFKSEQCKSAIEQMHDNGIVATGDICNTDETFRLKKTSYVQFHNFIEVFGFNDSMNDDYLRVARNNRDKSLQMGMPASITPHAPYSVSKKLMQNILKESKDAIITMHNQETAAENELFEAGTGELFETLLTINHNYKKWEKTKMSSLASVIHLFTDVCKLLLVHNLCTKGSDIDHVMEKNPNATWTLCPSSNLFIHNILPDLLLFINKKAKIAIGTDSLASNNQLCILEELKILQKKIPGTNIKNLLEWATINGASALNMDSDLGSFEKGKKPGVLLIENINFDQMKFTENSKVNRLL
jgi:aminodeoxyfutalosine deaminase